MRSPAPIDTALIERLNADLAAHADPHKAVPMQRYMKSALPFYGIQTPLRRRLLREACRAHPCADAESLAATMRELWKNATHREQRYCAAELARTGSHRRWLSIELLPVFEQMIVEGAWWDLCDELSAEAIGPLLAADPVKMKPILRRWARGADLWLRRAAILCQRRLGDAADARLLYQCIGPSIDSPEFFLRKGIGWALRERAYRAPGEVRAFVAECGHRLSPLTRREALKHLRPS